MILESKNSVGSFQWLILCSGDKNLVSQETIWFVFLYLNIRVIYIYFIKVWFIGALISSSILET